MQNVGAVRNTVSQFFSRTTACFLVALGFVVSYFFVEFTPILIQALNDDSGISTNYIHDSTSSYIIDFLSGLSLLPFARTLITAIIFGLFGLGLYTAYFFIRNMMIDARNHIESAVTDNRQVTQKDVLRLAGISIAKVVVYVIFVAISVGFFFRNWVDLIQIYILAALETGNLPYLVAGIAGFVVNVYLILAYGYLIWKNEQTRYAVSTTWKM